MDLASESNASWSPRRRPSLHEGIAKTVTAALSANVEEPSERQAIFHKIWEKLVERAYVPVFREEPALRWETLQRCLPLFKRIIEGGMELTRSAGLDEDESQSEDAAVTERAPSYEQDFPGAHEAILKGHINLQRREALIARNATRLDRLFALRPAQASDVAACGFIWAMVAIEARPLRELVSKPANARFAMSVLQRGAHDCYALLRAAENSLIDEEDDPPVEPGELDRHGRALEADAHADWTRARRLLG